MKHHVSRAPALLISGTSRWRGHGVTHRLLRPLGALVSGCAISLAAGPTAASEIPRWTDRAGAIPLADSMERVATGDLVQRQNVEAADPGQTRGSENKEAKWGADRELWEEELARARKDLEAVEAALRKIPEPYRSRRYRVRPYPYRSRVRVLKYRRNEMNEKIAELLEPREDP